MTNCKQCGKSLPDNAKCDNVGACTVADMHATRRAPGETLKAYRQPLAFTMAGNVD
jgi:hypothetical protein